MQAAGLAAPFSQPALKESEMRDLVWEQHEAAAYQQARAQENHLSDPFIMADSLRERMEARTAELGIRHKSHGLSTDPMAILQASQGNRGEAIVAARTYLAADSSLVPLLALLSLACRERLRSVLEDAYGTARARVFGSGGVVPPEWTDMAVGEGTAERTTALPQSLSGTPWDAIPDSVVNPLTADPSKRMSRPTLLRLS
jgi:hypothetical protein